MTKKFMLLTVLSIFSLVSLAVTPIRRPGTMSINPQIRNSVKTFMFFKAVKDYREKLNLNEKQNVSLDKILRDVEAYTQKIKEERKKDNFADQFVKDSFDPFQLEKEKQRKQEEIKNFYLSKIKAIHDLLTKEQRQTLVNIIKEKVQNMRKLKKVKEMQEWREKRMKKVPRNY